MTARRLAWAIGGAVAVGVSVLAPVVSARAATTPNVTTAGYGNLRDNWDRHETGLTPSVVQSSSFGQLFSTAVTGSVYSQPLVVNGTVVVTTEQAIAYGINATTGMVQWSKSFGSPFEAATTGCSDLTPDLGSTSTPVVDPTTGIVYVTTRLETGSGGLANAHWYLQAISSTNGQEQPGFPVEITGTPYNTPGVPFADATEEQRPALLLLNGVVYMAFASDCDSGPYRGIVVGVSTAGAITSMWSDEAGVGTDADSEAGIWQSGAGLVSDGPGNIILTTGNGVSPQPAASQNPPKTLSESVIGLKVNAKGKIKPDQFFSPSNAANLDSNDEDFGSGGPIALPPDHFGTSAHKQLLVQEGKDGRVMLIDADAMGGFKQSSGGALQKLGPYEGEWGHPAAYGGQGGYVYIMQSAGGPLRAFSYGLNGQGVPQLAAAGSSAEAFGYTSGSPLVTSNGTTAGSAIVWAVVTNGPSGAGGTLMAFGAVPTKGVLPVLWSAPIGTSSKFSVPTASNGRVYVGTRDGHVIAFGTATNAPLQAAAVHFGSVPVGSSRTTTVVASTPQGLTITGPASVSGYQGVTGPSAGSGAGTTTSSTVPGATAGPKTPPPAQSKPISSSVFSVHQPAAGTKVAPGSTFRVPITFTPDGPGAVVAELSIPTSEGTQTLSISGYGTAPGLTLSAEPLAFGTVQTGAGGKALTVSVTNSWNHPETVTGISTPGGPYSITGLPSVDSVLAPQQSVTASVNFNPTTAGSYPASLQITTNHGSVTAPISGTAVTGTEHLVVSAASVDAGSVPVGGTAHVTFTVGNSGTVALVVTRAIAPSGAFSAPVPIPEGITIEPGTSLKETVTFHPTATGPTTSRYTFNSNTGQGPVVVTLHGSGT